MPTIKAKTRKALAKQLRKLVKRYGPDAAVGLVTGLVGTIIAGAVKQKGGKKHQRKKETEVQEPVLTVAPETASGADEQLGPPADAVAPGPTTAANEQHAQPEEGARKAPHKPRKKRAPQEPSA